MATEARAGLARVACAQDDPAQALLHVEAILVFLKQRILVGPDESMRIYLTCYHVLQARHDSRTKDVRNMARQCLQACADWYEIQKDYDYGFVSVSTDDGKTWTTLKGNTTTDDDPQGQNYGNGLNDVSGVPGTSPDQGQCGKWIDEHFQGRPCREAF